MTEFVALAAFLVLLQTRSSREPFTTEEPTSEPEDLLPQATDEVEVSDEMVAPKFSLPVAAPPPPEPTPEPTPDPYIPLESDSVHRLFYSPYETNGALTALYGGEFALSKMYIPERTHGERPYASPSHQDTPPPDFSKYHTFDYLDRSHDANSLKAVNDTSTNLTPRQPMLSREAPYTGLPVAA